MSTAAVGLKAGEIMDIINEQARNELKKLEADSERYYGMRYTDTSYRMRGPSDALVAQERRRNITDLVLSILFPSIIPENEVVWVHGCVVGWPGCGKTELFMWLVEHAFKLYGESLVNVCYCNDLAIAIDRIDSRPVQLMIIDDATKCASSLNMMDRDNMDAAGIFQQLRHEYEEVSGKKGGIVICIFGWQRWMELRKSYRSGHVTIFKTAVSEKNDTDWMISNLGEMWYKELMNISGQILLRNNAAKSRSIAFIPALSQRGGIGYFRSQLSDIDDKYRKMLVRDRYTFQRRIPPSEIGKTTDIADWEIHEHAVELQIATGLEKDAAYFFHRRYIDKLPLPVIAFEAGKDKKKIEAMISDYREVLAYNHSEEGEAGA